MKRFKVFMPAILAIITSVLTMVSLTGCIGSKPPRYVIGTEEEKQLETESIYGQSPSDAKQDIQKTIVVSSESILKVVPNMVNVVISVMTEQPSSAESVNENTTKTDGVISAIKSLGINDLKIQTQGFTLNPLYNYPENMPPSIYAYRTVSSLKITTGKIERIGDIISVSIESGANEVSSIEYDLDEELKKSTKSEALSLAVKDADLKAEAIAEAMAAQIVEIVSVSEQGTSFTNPVYYMDREESFGAAKTADIASPEILPQEIEVHSQVEVIYKFK